MLANQLGDTLGVSQLQQEVRTQPFMVHGPTVAHPFRAVPVSQSQHMTNVVKQRRQDDFFSIKFAFCRLGRVQRTLPGLETVFLLRHGLAHVISGTLFFK